MPMTNSSYPTIAPSRPAAAWHLAVMRVLALWQFRRRTRNSLARLAPHHLRDIGLDALSAHSETAKPFWKD